MECKRKGRRNNIEIKVMEGASSVCRLRELGQIVIGDDLYSLDKTDEEVPLVRRTESVPQDTAAREDGWRAFRIRGELDLSLIGILAEISAVSVENRIGIFVMSTYNIDYVLAKADDFERALGPLESRGYGIAKQMHWQDGTGSAGDGFTVTGLLWLFPKNKCVNTMTAWKRWSASDKAIAWLAKAGKMDAALRSIRNRGGIYDILMSCSV